MDCKTVLTTATASLKAAGKDTNAANLLMCDALNIEKHQLLLHQSDILSVATQIKIKAGIERLLDDEPIQHILGYTYFYGEVFDVTKDVLVPRKETEELVEQTSIRIQQIFNDKPIDIVDVGVGSGVIACTLKRLHDDAHVSAIDISTKALRVAKKNAAKQQLHINFQQGDLLNPYIERQQKFEVIISNPPYIKESEDLDKVTLHDPHLALFGGYDGLVYYRRLFAQIPLVLKENGFVALEIGYDQKEILFKEIAMMLPGFKKECLKDFQGNDRIIFIYHKDMTTNT